MTISLLRVEAAEVVVARAGRVLEPVEVEEDAGRRIRISGPVERDGAGCGCRRASITIL